MSRELQWVPTDASLADVARVMASHAHSCILVGDPPRTAGLISERDLVRELTAVLAGAGAATAGEVMSSPVVSIGARQAVEEATQRMTTHRIRRLVVVDQDGCTVGLVTQSDIVRAHIARIEEHQLSLQARVAERTGELEAANEQLEALSRIDPLMGIGNRRGMEEALAMAHQRALRYRRSFSVILLDVDHFKAYNDTYGHPRGDRVLRDIGREVQGCIRMIDAAFRYGGEEVLVLLPETSEDGTSAVAERIRRSVAALAIEHQQSPYGIVTISGGVASLVPDPEGNIAGTFELLGAADSSLYEAKHSGRNRLGPTRKPPP